MEGCTFEYLGLRGPKSLGRFSMFDPWMGDLCGVVRASHWGAGVVGFWPLGRVKFSSRLKGLDRLSKASLAWTGPRFTCALFQGVSENRK